MASTFPLLAVAAIAAAPHLGACGAGSTARVAAALLRERARRYGTRLRTKASSAS